MQDFQAAFQAEIEKALKAQNFPASEIPEDFSRWVNITLKFESKASIGCSTETLVGLHRINPSNCITLFEMGFLLNAIERRTPREWMEYADAESFGRAIAAADAMSAKWNEIVNPIKNSIMNKLQTQMRISKGVPQGKKLIGQA